MISVEIYDKRNRLIMRATNNGGEDDMSDDLILAQFPEFVQLGCKVVVQRREE